MHNLVIPSFLAMLMLTSCGKEKCRESNIVETQVKLQVERLEDELFKANSSAEVKIILERNQGFAIGFLDTDQYPSDTIVPSRYFGLLKDPSIDTLFKDSKAEYADFSDITSQLESGIGKIKALYPDFQVPKIQTVITGLYKDLYISDSLIVIGIDHFLGENAKYKPLDVPEYIYRRYDKEHMAAMIVSFIGGGFNNSNFLDKTMLAEMIDYGKTYYFVSRILPCVSEHIVIGYTEEEWRDSKKNDGIIWANFIENELLYEVNHTIKNKFIGERPKVFEIGEKCPGRIGRWVGWQIVEAYMAQNPNISLPDLMAETDAQKIFQRSKYKPRN